VSPDQPSVQDPWDVLPPSFTRPEVTHVLVPASPPRPKFQHRYTRHALLFLATLAMTTYVGIDNYLGWASFHLSTIQLMRVQSWGWGTALAHGLWYSLPLLVILGAHEFGHYAYCRRHNVDATLPYFIPGPPVLTGTFGAVIRIREAFPSKKALFDIGVAGPIAGFLALLPFLYFGMNMSAAVKIAPSPNTIHFGDPLLLKAVAWLHFGPLPPGFDVVLHPMGFAAWWGMLATALNLLPFGQLDGGHIAYAVLGRRSGWVSIATLTAVVMLTLVSLSWISMTLLLLIMAFFLGFRHPRILDEGTPLDGRRRLVALFALVIFILCFTPVPIETFFGR
jgi:membrane-associated protease RseP (regulator of RpoE activity)